MAERTASSRHLRLNRAARNRKFKASVEKMYIHKRRSARTGAENVRRREAIQTPRIARNRKYRSRRDAADRTWRPLDVSEADLIPALSAAFVAPRDHSFSAYALRRTLPHIL